MNDCQPRSHRAGRRGLVAAALAAMFAFAGCGDLNVDLSGACRVDGDCAAGLRCHDARFCVAQPGEERTILLRMDPPPGSPAVLEHFDAQVGGASGKLGQTFQLTAPAVVRGTVMRDGDALSASIPGTLLAIAPGKVAGTPLRYETTSYQAPKRFDDAGGAYGFQLKLQIGPTYEVGFWPEHDQIPPFFSTWKVGGTIEDWTVQLPAESALLRVKGRLRVGAATALNCSGLQQPTLPSCDGTCTPLPDMRVVLRDGQGRVASSRVVTDSEGAFVLLVDPTAGKVQLALQPATADGSTPAATLATAIDLDLLRKKDKSELDLGDLVVASLAPVRSAQVRVRTSDGAKVVGAQVRAREAIVGSLGCLADDKGVLGLRPVFDDLRTERTMFTDAEGNISLDVIGDVVEIAVQPGPSAKAGAAHVKVATKAGSVDVVCPPRRKVSGTVADYGQRPLLGARLLFERLGGASAGELGSASPPQAETGTGGAFALYLDAGRYAVVVDPPPGVGLARAVMRIVDVDADHDPLPLDLTIPAPSVLVGRVVDDSGAPVAGVMVDVLALQLALLGTDGSPAGDKSRSVQRFEAKLTMTTHLLGSVVTDAHGAFEALVAAFQVAGK